MSSVAPPLTAPAETLAELLARVAPLADIPAHRIRMDPPPGTATEADLLTLEAAADKRLCELIDGTLVEKPMGFIESLLARRLVVLLEAFIYPRNLGLLTLPDGFVRLFPGRVRIPDIAFLSWDRLPGRVVPRAAIPTVVPDLAVEVLSPSNTPGEMRAKRDDYFQAGVRLVWEVDPATRTVAVFRQADAPEAMLTAADTLTGEPVLPGFTLPLAELFGELDRHG